MDTNTSTHYHRCQSGRVLKTTTRKDTQKVFFDVGFVDGGDHQEGLDILDGLLCALETVSQERGVSSAGGWLMLSGGRSIFLIGCNKSGEAFSCRRENLHQHHR